jgi:hypothetical protein
MAPARIFPPNHSRRPDSRYFGLPPAFRPWSLLAGCTRRHALSHKSSEMILSDSSTWMIHSSRGRVIRLRRPVSGSLIHSEAFQQTIPR